MKKLLLVLLTLTVFNTTLTAKASKADTTFTFQNFVPTSPDAVRALSKTKVLGTSHIQYPMFVGGKIATTMNKEMERFINDFKESKLADEQKKKLIDMMNETKRKINDLLTL